MGQQKKVEEERKRGEKREATMKKNLRGEERQKKGEERNETNKWMVGSRKLEMDEPGEEQRERVRCGKRKKKGREREAEREGQRVIDYLFFKVT